MSNILCK